LSLACCVYRDLKIYNITRKHLNTIFSFLQKIIKVINVTHSESTKNGNTNFRSTYLYINNELCPQLIKINRELIYYNITLFIFLENIYFI